MQTHNNVRSSLLYCVFRCTTHIYFVQKGTDGRRAEYSVFTRRMQNFDEIYDEQKKVLLSLDEKVKKIVGQKGGKKKATRKVSKKGKKSKKVSKRKKVSKKKVSKKKVSKKGKASKKVSKRKKVSKKGKKSKKVSKRKKVSKKK